MLKCCVLMITMLVGLTAGIPTVFAQDTITGTVTQTVTVAPATAQQILARLENANNIREDRVQAIDLVSSDELNASTDGQKIYFTTKLWNVLHTDDQRAFVIGHELSHIQLHHVTQTALREYGISWLNSFLVNRFGSNSTWVALASKTSLGLLDRKFSRSQEYGADDLGLQLMDKAGYNTEAAIEVFRIFEQYSSGSHTPEFLQNHPLDKSRIERLSAKYHLSLH